MREADRSGDTRSERDEQANPTRRRGQLDAATDDNEESEFLGIMPRLLPNAGMCRVWVPGLPNGQQARPTTCDGIVSQAPAGSWILRRTGDDPNVVFVDYVHPENVGVIVRTSAFNAETGDALRNPT